MKTIFQDVIHRNWPLSFTFLNPRVRQKELKSEKNWSQFKSFFCVNESIKETITRVLNLIQNNSWYILILFLHGQLRTLYKKSLTWEWGDRYLLSLGHRWHYTWRRKLLLKVIQDASECQEGFNFCGWCICSEYSASFRICFWFKKNFPIWLPKFVSFTGLQVLFYSFLALDFLTRYLW